MLFRSVRKSWEKQLGENKKENPFQQQLPTKCVVDHKPLQHEPIHTGASTQKCPWCGWTGQQGEKLCVHIKSCKANHESTHDDADDDGNWFVPEGDKHDCKEWKLWHLPDGMGAAGSACGTVPLNTPYREVCTMSMPTSQICFECLARHPDRWVHCNENLL